MSSSGDERDGARLELRSEDRLKGGRTVARSRQVGPVIVEALLTISTYVTNDLLSIPFKVNRIYEDTWRPGHFVT